MYKEFIENIDLNEKYVFVRNDFNVPLDKDEKISDDTRITESLKSLKYLIDKNAKIICASHLGRPGGLTDPKLSLKPVAKRLSELLNKDIIFTGETIGTNVDKIKSNMKNGDILLLENLRFNSGEKSNDSSFSKELAKHIDVFVNDAFGSSHRNHASISGITKYVPVSVMGYLLKKEVDFLKLALNNPPEKFTVILGGAKVADKLGVISNLIGKVNSILIGGAMAYTFLKAKGMDVGSSVVEYSLLETCKNIIKESENKGINLLLPIDHIAAVKIEPNITIRMIKPGENIPPDMMGLDIGFDTVEMFRKEILLSEMIFWNGPMGVFEVNDFSGGTTAITEAVAESPAISIVGGGDTISAINSSGVTNNISHISTGGGASLKFMAGETLPGLENLSEG